MLIKKRTAKCSERGIYLQDTELKDTKFQPGEKYSWIIDPENRQLIILPGAVEGNIVSKRMRQEEFYPVIDIRKKEVLSLFKGADYLQVNIFEDQILVEGFIKDETSKLSGIEFNGKVSHISQFSRVKKLAAATISRDQLKMAMGDSETSWTSTALTSISEPAANIVSLDDAIPTEDFEVPLQIGSLFSGAGILDSSFIEQGFDVIYAIERDPDAAETYRTNIGDHIQVADIRHINKLLLPQVPVLLAGPPCQGFSNSNRKTNFLDNPNNLLVREYVETIKANPKVKVFVLENVPGILTAGHGQFVEEIKEELSDFEIQANILNSADYGTSMIRKRAFIIGSRIGPIDWPSPSVKFFCTVREAFRGIHSDIPNQQDVSQPKEMTRKRMSFVPSGGNVYDIPEDIRPRGTHSITYRRLKWDEPSCSIANFRKAVIMHPEENRILSVREAARLFGVSDSFVFKGSLNAKQQQISNSVPFKMGQAIAREVKKAISRYHVRIKNMFRKQTPAF